MHKANTYPVKAWLCARDTQLDMTDGPWDVLDTGTPWARRGHHYISVSYFYKKKGTLRPFYFLKSCNPCISLALSIITSLTSIYLLFSFDIVLFWNLVCFGIEQLCLFISYIGDYFIIYILHVNTNIDRNTNLNDIQSCRMLTWTDI